MRAFCEVVLEFLNVRSIEDNEELLQGRYVRSTYSTQALSTYIKKTSSKRRSISTSSLTGGKRKIATKDTGRKNNQKVLRQFAPVAEMWWLFSAFKKGKLDKIFVDLDGDKSGRIDLNELVEGVLRWHLFVAAYTIIDPSRVPSRNDIKEVFDRYNRSPDSLAGVRGGLNREEFETVCVILMSDLSARMAWFYFGRLVISIVVAPLLFDLLLLHGWLGASSSTLFASKSANDHQTTPFSMLHLAHKFIFSNQTGILCVSFALNFIIQFFFYDHITAMFDLFHKRVVVEANKRSPVKQQKSL